MKKQPIRYWNRRSRVLEDEKIYGDGALRFLYENPLGRWLAASFLSRPWFSRWVGKQRSAPRSRKAIPGFIERFEIPMEEFLEEEYRSFNEFFVRRFRPGQRMFCERPGDFPAFAEGRYLAFESIDPQQTFPVKGELLHAEALLGGAERAAPFAGGPLVIARLCPTDYHRFHFPDSGRVAESYRIPGLYHSVNPLALRARPDIFATNERHVSLLETDHFGTVAYVEVGAMSVGKIVNTHAVESPFDRGDEKGYFLFGASTVIVLGERGRWSPDADLLEKTDLKIETLVRLGERVGRAE